MTSTTDAASAQPEVVSADPLDMNARMVEREKAGGSIRSAQVEAAFRAVPRHLFLPGVPLERVYGGDVIVTRSDEKGQPTSSSSQIAIMAPMLEDLDVRPGHRVLEIGAGTGYNAALLDHLVGTDGEVVTVELDAEIAAQARENVATAGHDRVRVVVGDGYAGHPGGAPYDRIIATASVTDLPRSWLDQLREDGRLTVPLRLGPSAQLVVTFRRRGDSLESVALIPGGFMALRGEPTWAGPATPIDGDWEASIQAPVDDDAATLAALLRQVPAIEPLRDVPWQVTALLGLLEPDAITVRHRHRQGAWSGLYDRASRSLALFSPAGLPMQMMRWMVLVYGPLIARDRLIGLIDRLAGTDLRDLRITAIPVDRGSPGGDGIVGRSFRYAISRGPGSA